MITAHATRPVRLEDRAKEILDTVPAARRLCAGFERSLQGVAERARRPLRGVILLVGAVDAAMVPMALWAGIPQRIAALAAAATVAAALLALLVLDALRRRDGRRLRAVQGPRLLLALQLAGPARAEGGARPPPPRRPGRLPQLPRALVPSTFVITQHGCAVEAAGRPAPARLLHRLRQALPEGRGLADDALPVDEVKIDRAFVVSLDDADRRAMVLTIVRLLDTLDVRTVAEGVETARQLAYVGSMGIDACQGFYLSPPLPASDLPGALEHCEAREADALQGGVRAA